MELSNFKVADAEQVFLKGFRLGIEPEPILTVSEWADRHRMLSQRASAEPGQWRTSRTPYLKEIMDCLSNTSPVQEVIFMKGAQIGGTETGNNWIGYVIDHAPGPMMAVQPTVDTAKRNSKQRIAPLIEECPTLKDKVKDPKARDSGNTLLSKEFPGGVLVMTGANSAVGLRSMPVRYMFLDEVDGYPGDVDGEGDPVQLARARTRTFSKKKIFECSTPTIAGRSRIEFAFDNSDRRRYNVPCPECGEFQVLKWTQVKWPKGEPQKAYYQCEHCDFKIYEHMKTKMFSKGKWIAEKPGVKQGKVAGFHLSSLYSPVGWFSWADAAELWEKSKDSPERLRGFVNTVLGETWQDKGEAPEWLRLYERRDKYEFNVVPSGAAFLTCGVDVQKDRLELEIVAWGRGKRSWSVDYRVIRGDTSRMEPWSELDEVLSETWPVEGRDGIEMPLKLMAVDSGYNTQQVYSWCRKYPLTRVVAIKGSEKQTLPVGQPNAVDVKKHGGKFRNALKIFPIGVSLLKSELYGWLRQPSPVDGEPDPIGFCRFPQYAEEYFKQLCAEELVIKLVKGYRKYEWQKVRDRNEALDCRVYARAAASICGLDRFKDENWEKLEREIGVSVQKTVKKVETIKRTRRESSFWR